jgi:hypothetical protein
VLWFAGIDNGKDSSDLDRKKNYWGGLRVEVPDTAKSNFVGSTVGFHYYAGTDTASSATARIENDFKRYTFAANARVKDTFDLQATYQIGKDDNYALEVAPVSAKFYGFTASAAYWTYPVYVVLQYDQIDSDDVPGLEIKKLSPSIWLFMRQNFKAGIAARFDLSSATVKKHEVALQLRTMF